MCKKIYTVLLGISLICQYIAMQKNSSVTVIVCDALGYMAYRMNPI
jgi:hypothetical protein